MIGGQVGEKGNLGSLIGSRQLKLSYWYGTTDWLLPFFELADRRPVA